jgi:surface antigen
MKTNRLLFWVTGLLVLSLVGFWKYKYDKKHKSFSVGQPLDSLNGVWVYYNGGVAHVEGRNTTPDGYNLGLKYQCVEFVKRYYYEYLNHKMPNSYGNAKDFFDKNVPDGQINKARNLRQFSNPSYTKPKVSDLVVFDGTLLNKYGHVAIISRVNDHEIELIQQNTGQLGQSREVIKLNKQAKKWKINHRYLLGWLRKK